MADRRVSFIIGANIKNFTKGLDNAQKRFRSFGNTMQSVGRNLSTKLTLPIVGAGVAAVKTAADYEKLRTSMDVLNGSTEEGARNFERLKEFSARTPFQLQDLASAQNMLQGFSLSADDAFDSLSMIGDIAAVTGGDIQGIGVAFGQAAAEGQVMTRDIRQFINQGVPMVQMLAETMGVATSEIFDLASQGEITFDILQQSFRDATSEGGMFANGMERQSKTLSGLFSTLKDNISLALGAVGDDLAETLNLRGVLENRIKMIQNAVEWFKGLSTEAKRAGIAMLGFAAAIGPTIMLVGKLAKFIGLLISPLALKIALLAALAAGFTYVVKNADAFQEHMKYIMNNALKFVVDGVSGMLKWLGEFAAKTGQKNLALGLMQMSASAQEFAQGVDLSKPTTEFQNFSEFFNDMKGDVVSGLNSIMDAFLGLSGASAGTLDVERPENPVGFMSAGLKTAKDRTRELSQAIIDTATVVTGIARPSFEGFTETTSNGLIFATGLANQFTNSFGQGMANIVVQGEKLVDVLKNIGKLLLSSTIQTGISMLLTGGIGGGITGGLFGRIFGVNDALITSSGDVVQFHPDDNILAMKDFSNLGAPVPSPSGAQVIENVLVIDGEVLYRNQKEVSYKRGR